MALNIGNCYGVLCCATFDTIFHQLLHSAIEINAHIHNLLLHKSVIIHVIDIHKGIRVQKDNKQP